MWQNIVVYVIGALLAAYLCYKLYAVVTRKSKGGSVACSTCEGCSGCDLKIEIERKRAEAKQKK